MVFWEELITGLYIESSLAHICRLVDTNLCERCIIEKGCLESSLEPVVGMLKTLLHVNKKSHLRVD